MNTKQVMEQAERIRMVYEGCVQSGCGPVVEIEAALDRIVKLERGFFVEGDKYVDKCGDCPWYEMDDLTGAVCDHPDLFEWEEVEEDEEPPYFCPMMK